MIILHDPTTLKHRTIEFAYGRVQDALESPERITSILKALKATDHDVRTITFANTTRPSFHDHLASTHAANYLHHLETAHAEWVKTGVIEAHESILPECFPFPTGTNRPEAPPKDVFARPGYFAFDMSTGIMSETWTAALASANLAVQGANLITSMAEDQTTPPAKSVLALCRPPGHHCDTQRAGGYCYINNAVIAIHTLRTHHYPSAPSESTTKIAVLDLDFHHGNGTQTFYYTNPRVLYVSIHGENEFPYYTGSASETGAEAGEGFNLNIPLPTASSFKEYLEKLEMALDRMVEFQPEYLLLSLGFDTFHLDPIGNFKIDTEDYEVMARKVRGRAELKNVPGLILLEGGYVVERLGENVVSFLRGWESAEK